MSNDFVVTRKDPPCVCCQPDAVAPVKFAAAELRRYLTQILAVPIAEGAACGRRPIELEVGAETGLGDEGYELTASAHTLRIRGGGAVGVVYGVYELLRRYAGCQFSGYAPDGEHVPRLDCIAVPKGTVRRKPKLWYRGMQFYGASKLEDMIANADWMAKNGMNYVMISPLLDFMPASSDKTGNSVDPATGEIRFRGLHGRSGRYTIGWFREHLLPEIRKRGLKLDMNHHNLFAWLPPEVYFDQHPEWYPLGELVRNTTTEEVYIWFRAERETMHRFLAAANNQVAELLERAMAAGLGPYFSVCAHEMLLPPWMGHALFDEFVFLYDKRVNDVIHRHGGKLRAHCHGNCMDFLEKMAAMGIDAIEPLEHPPAGDVDLAEAKRRVGDRMMLCGNIASERFLFLTPAEVRLQVRDAIRAAAAGGGFALRTSGGHCGTCMQLPGDIMAKVLANVEAYILAGLEFCQYPIRE